MTTSLPTLDGADLDALVAGPVLRPGDDGYAEETDSFNRTHTAAPAIVVGATCAADVAATVRWAAGNGYAVAVQSTGHGLMSDLFGSVLVSTRRMAEVTIDPATRIARAGAGARWAQVVGAAVPYGLAPLSGSSSHVGVVGYTLGGGLGPLARRYGFAADLVRRVQIVTADGVLRDVDADRDPDLFWAVRGGKGNFGIVTELEFELVPVARLYGGGIFFPGEAAAEVLHAWHRWAGMLTDDTTTSIAVLRLPPLPTLPESLRGRTVVHLRVAHLGSAEEGAELLAPMRAVAPAIMDLVAEMPFAAVDAIHMDPTDPMPIWERGTALTALPSEALDAFLSVAGPEVEVPLIMAEIRLLGGAVGRQAAVPNAVAGRDAAFSVIAIGPMEGPWLRSCPP